MPEQPANHPVTPGLNRPTVQARNHRATQWLILAVLLVLLIAGESFALYTIFTSQFPGGNDFFVRWLGGREYLLHGTNPFDQSVAEKAQVAMFGHLARPGDKDEAYFAYPLYTLYFFWPLSLLPYAWAQAIWMTWLQFVLLGSTLLAVRLAGWDPPNWLFWFTLFWGIFFYNGARAIILGQFSILVSLFLMLALWAIGRRRDGWAGIFLSLTTIKPQMVFLVLAFLLLWALANRRWRLIGGFVGGVLALVGSSVLLVPTWPVDFARNVIAYSDYVSFGTPLENLLHYLLPAAIAAPLTILLSVLFLLALLPGWWLALHGQPGAYTWSVFFTLIVGSLISFRSATTNQVILYLPLFFFFLRLSKGHWGVTAQRQAGVDGSGQRAAVAAVLIEAGLMVLMWGAFALTLEGNWEHVMLHGLLPALMLLFYAADWRSLWRAARELERQKLLA
jgi:hypothetical protein